MGKDIRNAKWAIIFITAYFVLSKTLLGSFCPFLLMTGFPCPACGLTRAGILFMRMDFAGAFRMQPFIYPIFLFIAALFLNRYVFLKNMPKWAKGMAVFVIFCMLVFYIWRMLRCFPGEEPMNFYKNNFLHRWKQFASLDML